MTQLSLREIALILRVPVPPQFEDMADEKFKAIDSVMAVMKKGSIFFMRVMYQGHVPNADEIMKRGAKFLVNNKRTYDENGKELPCLVVDDVEAAYILVNRWIKSNFDAKTIAITGSVGKTTSKEMVARVVEKKFNTLTSRLNRNSSASTSHYIQELSDKHEVYVQEVGGAHPGYVESSAKLLRADAFMITNIGMSHVGNYGNDQMNILKDKASLDTHLADTGVGFVAYDDPLLREYPYTHPVTFYSATNTEADYYAENIEYENEAMRFVVVEKSSGVKTPVFLKALGNHNVENAVGAFAIGRWLGMKEEEIVSGLADFEAEGMRQNYTRLGGRRVYIDCFNSSEKSLLATVEAIKNIKIPEGGKRILVAGDIAELGEFSKAAHQRIGKALALESDIEHILLFGEEMAYAASEMYETHPGLEYFTDRAKLNERIKKHLKPKDLIVFKASHGTGLFITIDQIFGTALSTTNLLFLFEHSRIGHDELSDYRIIDEIGGVYRRPRNLKSSTQKVIIPEPVRTLAERAFADSKVREVSLPSSLLMIEDEAFKNCRFLEELEIPRGVRTLGKEAFAECPKLKRLVIPSSVQTIRKGVLNKTRNVELVCVEGSTAAKFFAKNWPSRKLRLVAKPEKNGEE